jgi:DNA-binding MarR family transcriptional regulator
MLSNTVLEHTFEPQEFSSDGEEPVSIATRGSRTARRTASARYTGDRYAGSMPTRLALTLASVVESGHLLAKLADRARAVRMPAATMRAIAVLSAEGAMSVTALARRCHVAQPTMSTFVQQAEREGWLRRTGSGQSTRMEPTPEGLEARERQRDAIGTALEPRFVHLGARERATLERAAMILASALERDRTAP